MLRALSIAATFLAAGCPSHGPASYPAAVDDTAVADPDRARRGQARRRRRAELASSSATADAGDEGARAARARPDRRRRGARGDQGAPRRCRIRRRRPRRSRRSASRPRSTIRAARERGRSCPQHDEAAVRGRRARGVRTRRWRSPIRPRSSRRRRGQAAEHRRERAELALGRDGARASSHIRTRARASALVEARAAIAAATSATPRPTRWRASTSRRTNADVVAALASSSTDDDPETRATAIAGLAKRDAIAAARTAIEESLRDRDWRVAVEAVRALAGEHGDDGRSRCSSRRTSTAGGPSSSKATAREAQVLRREPAPAHRAPRPRPDRRGGAHRVRDPRRARDRVDGRSRRSRARGSPSSPRSRTREVAHQLATSTLFTRGELPDYLRVALAADAYPHGDADVPARGAAHDARARRCARARRRARRARRRSTHRDRPLARRRRSPRRSRRPIRSSRAPRSMRPATLYDALGDDTALRASARRCDRAARGERAGSRARRRTCSS